MQVHILGIRHHGVGSARNVAERLKQIQPDLVLVEGPPEISEALKIIGHSELVPPVSLMLYDEHNLKNSSFYPFAQYSPEWVAAKYANNHSIPVKAIDLPAKISFALNAENENACAIDADEITTTPIAQVDPLYYLAQAAGFDSGEAWWDQQFESTKSKDNPEDWFAAVLLAMKTLRENNIPSSLDQRNIDREAYMRHLIRTAQKELYSNIAVICGAWHAPALIDLDGTKKEDAKILKLLPKTKIKVSASWIPWTNGRLARQSGYGAGIINPGWYEHQWQCQEDLPLEWLSKAAYIFRKEQVDVSTAHVLESYRLAHSLALLRMHSQINYQDLNDSINTVMCEGEELVFKLINHQLNVNEKIGSIPADLPKVPLQQDFESTIKSLRLKLSAMPKDMNLDLRKPLDLKRSIFFHRIEILQINWAAKKQARTKGTFKESWQLIWNPEMGIQIIEKAHLGNSIPMAARNFIKESIANEMKTSVLVALLQKTIPAELFLSMDDLLQKIQDATNVSSDTKDLMRALPQMIRISRYGDVRNTDLQKITFLCDRLFQKITISMVNACYGLDEDNSNEMFELISHLDQSLKLISTETIQQSWHSKLRELSHKDGVHMVIKGCTIRLLFDQAVLSENEISQLISYHLSPKQNAFDVAAWIEGFLRGSGLILIYDNKIWNLLYAWVAQINSEQFIELLPVLRRAFSKFPFGERRRIGEKAKSGLVSEQVLIQQDDNQNFDHEAAKEILPFIKKYLIS